MIAAASDPFEAHVGESATFCASGFRLARVPARSFRDSAKASPRPGPSPARGAGLGDLKVETGAFAVDQHDTRVDQLLAGEVELRHSFAERSRER